MKWYGENLIMKQRSRIIKPDYFQDRDINRLNEKDQKLFQGLWTLADKTGMLEYIPELIKGFIFPFHLKYNVKNMLQNLENGGFIEIYTNNHKNYLRVINFKKHQNPHPKEAQYDIPDLKELHLIKLKLIKVNVKSPISYINSISISNTNSNNVEQAIDDIPFDLIIQDLNKKVGSSYRSNTKTTKKLITDLWTDFSIDDFYKVHNNMAAAWLNDPKMQTFLRPSTLYRKSHFEEYLNKPQKQETGAEKFSREMQERENNKGECKI